MTSTNLKNHLRDTRLFTDAEVHKIVRACGSLTLGNAVIACEVLNITLTGSDVDAIFT
jgi:hypothetical protein